MSMNKIQGHLIIIIYIQLSDLRDVWTESCEVGRDAGLSSERLRSSDSD